MGYKYIQIGTGQLEGKVYGITAQDVLNSTNISIFPENEERDRDHVLHKRSLTGVAFNLYEHGNLLWDFDN